jgi:hypothetical protein
MTDTTVNQTETDAGHAGHGGHEKPRYDDINVTTVVIVGFISAVITVLTILFVKGLLSVWVGKYERMRADEVVNMPAKVQVMEQKKQLEGGEGILSIEEAAEKVLSKYGSN